ncbi:MAG: hypothetical protein BMS9Abin02_1939 [Anaerolineae bacterium]|nr:MAG: hypothetical protein BMS9Abin02_1939 [Anaerolineae bacterium]
MKTVSTNRFKMSEAFFPVLSFSRAGNLPEPLNIQLRIQLQVRTDKLPDQLQIHLKTETIEDQPFKISVLMVGIFDLIDGEPDPDPKAVDDFVINHALFSMWPLMASTVRQISARMGMEPLKMAPPARFEIDDLEITMSKNAESGLIGVHD